MKRNLLMLLFAMLIGVFTSNAQDVRFTIWIDNPAMAAVSVNSPMGDPLDLWEEYNSVTAPSGRPLFIRPLNGASLTVTVNEGAPLDLLGAGDMMYYNTIISQGMFVRIQSEGGEVGPSTISTSITLNNPGSAELINHEGEKFDIVNGVYDLLDGEWATIAPKDGWKLKECGFGSAFTPDMWTQNSDGTVSFKPVQYGSIYVQTKLNGIDFNVDVNVAGNVIVNAFDAAGEGLGVVNLENGAAPFIGTAPTAATDLSFTAVEGGRIVSITRVEAGGQRTELPDGNQSEGGWRSTLAAGDTFVIEAVGPETEIRFTGYCQGETWYALPPADAFVVTIAGQPVEFEAGAMECFAKAHIGDIITATTRRGYALVSPKGIEGVTYTPLVNEGAVQSGIIAGDMGIVLNAVVNNNKVINIDHAAGAIVTGNFGTGAVLELHDGENVLTDVPNPLKIVASEGWMILSVTLDGENVRPQGNAYTATLEAGSILDIKTRETDKPFIVTINAIGGGSRENLIVKQNDQVVDPADILQATNYSSITIAAKPGYIIKSVTDYQGNSVSYNQKTNVYTVFFTNAASMISVEFEEPQNGEVFVGFDCEDPAYCLVPYDAEGNFITDILGEGRWYIWPGFTAKLPAGGQVKVATFTGFSCLETVTVNGTTTTYDVEDFVRKTDFIKLDTERTAISATIAYPEFPISISGSQALETELGSGVVIGTVYINEVGTMLATAWPGETVKVIPVPAKGYKFEKFSYYDGDQEIDYSFKIDGPDADGVYSFTIPTDFVAETIYMRGIFTVDEENPVYLIFGDRIYVGQGSEDDDLLVGEVRVNEGTDLFAEAGERIEIGFYRNPAYDYYCEYFCTYNHPDTPLDYEIDPVTGRCYYTVNPDDVAFSNVIMISAKVKEGAPQVGIDGVDADSDFNFDAASGILTSATDVKVYNAAGQLVKVFTAGENNLAALPEGLYLLTNGVKTLKIAK